METAAPAPCSVPAAVLRPHPNKAHCTGNVALKFMRADFGRDRKMLARFRAERQNLANLNHPNMAVHVVVKTLEVDTLVLPVSPY